MSRDIEINERLRGICERVKFVDLWLQIMNNTNLFFNGINYNRERKGVYGELLQGNLPKLIEGSSYGQIEGNEAISRKETKYSGNVSSLLGEKNR